LAAVALGTLEAWAWAGLHVLLAAVLPTVYVAWLVHTGEVTDMHLRVREQRLRPMTLCTVTSALSVLLLGFGGASPLVLTLAVAQLLQAVAFLGFTQRWKVSAHCAAAGGLAVLATVLWGQHGAFLGAGVLLVAWSRLHLRRHTLLQTVAGTALGLGLWSVVLSAAGF
jgi:membrane-associated phospholipid phosphatase